MKNLVVICVVLGVLGLVKGEDSVYQKTYKPLIDECNSAGNYTEGDIAEILDRKKYATSLESACLQACVDEKYGIIKNGKYGVYNDSLELMEALFTDNEAVRDKMKIFVRDCLDEDYNKDNICDIAGDVRECFVDSILYT